MSKFNFRYYLITSRKVCAPRPLPERVNQACKNGIKAVQLREKDLNDRELFELAKQIREITHRYNAMLFINDRVDIAIAVGADGVHCRETSLSPKTIKKLDRKLIVGASVHSIERAQKAWKEEADFLMFGPVFYTASKASYGQPQGTERLGKIADNIPLPVFGVGGIIPERAASCMEAGAAGVAGISSMMKSSSVDITVKKWKNILQKY